MAEQIVPPGNANFARLLRDAGARHAERPAIVERGTAVSYAAIAARAAGIATALRERGVGEGDRVGILLRRGPDAAAAFFGAAAVGAVVTNINELYRPRQIEYVLAHAGAAALLTSADLLASLPRPLETPAMVLDVGGMPREGSLEPAERRPSDPAQITYTSGSTGQPKGVLFSHANLWAGVRLVQEYLGITSDDRVASLLPFSFVYGFNQLTLTLAAGATLVIERSTLPGDIVAALREQRVTVVAGVPPLWLQLLRTGDFRARPIESLRIATNAGGRLPPDAALAIRVAQPQTSLFLMYGLTEVFRSTYLPPEQVDRRPDSMGRSIPRSRAYVLREDGTPCAPGEVGELVHGGPTVGLGYWNDPEATARVYRPDPLRPDLGDERVVWSGDLVRADEEGFLYYVSRKDRVIKSLGYRISPDEIADVMYASGQIAEGLVVGEPDEQRGQSIVAYVVLAEGGSLAKLRAHCGAELPRYMVPVRWEVLPSIPRNGSGKHDVLQLQRDRERALAAQ